MWSDEVKHGFVVAAATGQDEAAIALEMRTGALDTRRGARAAAAAASQPGRIPRSAIVAILAAVRRSTPVRVVPVN